MTGDIFEASGLPALLPIPPKPLKQAITGRAHRSGTRERPPLSANRAGLRRHGLGPHVDTSRTPF
jgi:hypothetical protein